MPQRKCFSTYLKYISCDKEVSAPVSSPPPSVEDIPDSEEIKVEIEELSGDLGDEKHELNTISDSKLEEGRQRCSLDYNLPNNTLSR